MTPDFLPLPLAWRACERVWEWFISSRPAKRLKLEVQVNDPTLWSQIRIVNSGKQPVILHATDWCIGRRRNRRCFDSVTWDREILPENTFEIVFSPYGFFPEIVSRYSGGEDLHTLRFRAHTSSGKMRIFHPGKELIDCLTKPHQGYSATGKWNANRRNGFNHVESRIGSFDTNSGDVIGGYRRAKC